MFATHLWSEKKMGACLNQPPRSNLRITHHPHRALTVLRESQQGGDNVVGTDVPFELRGFSLATVALGVGALITIGSLAEVGASQVDINLHVMAGYKGTFASIESEDAPFAATSPHTPYLCNTYTRIST